MESAVIALGRWGEATQEVGLHLLAHAAAVKPRSALGSQPRGPACRPPLFPLTNISSMLIYLIQNLSNKSTFKHFLTLQSFSTVDA